MFKLVQAVTYWTPTANNGTGGKTWSSGVKVDARIAETDKVLFTPEGKQYRANKFIYVTTSIVRGSRVIEGDFAGQAAPEATAELVIDVSSNSSFTNMIKLTV